MNTCREGDAYYSWSNHFIITADAKRIMPTWLGEALQLVRGFGGNCIVQHHQVTQDAQGAAPVIALQCKARGGAGDDDRGKRRCEPACRTIGSAKLVSLEGHWLLHTTAALEVAALNQ
jgi:hypothetical protein